MFYDMYMYWKKHDFLIALVLSIFILFIISIFKINYKNPRIDPFILNYRSVRSVPIIDKPTPFHDKKGYFRDSKGEIECRRVLETIFNRPFRKSRPAFLRNKINGRSNLELDCYNDDLKIGLEYDGSQHRKYNPYFHRSKEEFMNQQYRDYMKDQLCKENNIQLIRVSDTIPIHKIESYIKSKLFL